MALLTVLWLLPLAGAAAVPLAHRLVSRSAGKPVALAVAVATLVVGAFARGHEVVSADWIPLLGAHYALGVDGMGYLMVLLSAVLVPLVFGFAWRSHAPGWFALALALESMALLVFLSEDLFLFYVAFEATLIPAYFLIGRYGGALRAVAALKFLMYQLGGGLVLLIGVVAYFVYSSRAGDPSYLLSDLAGLDLPTEATRWIFAAFFIAFAVKAPLFPVHTWLADTTAEATPATSVLLVCILDKIGTFAMIRLCLGLLPEASDWATPVVIVVALVSIVYGAFLAIGQDDLLRLVGLTSLSHFGLITLGVFAGSAEGLTGAILYMVNHGIATAAFFLAAGAVIERTGTASIGSMRGGAMRGMERLTPVLAGFFLVAGLATAGLPGLSQFVSEILVLIAAFDHHWLVGAIAVTAIVLAAIYALWAYQRIFTGGSAGGREGAPGEGSPAHFVGASPEAPSLPPAGPRDLAGVQVVVLGVLTAALVVFGLWPHPLLDQADETTDTYAGVLE